MSQPQTQHKPSMLNGLNRRHGDRELGGRPESYRSEYNKSRSSRSASNNNLGTESFRYAQIDQSHSSNAGQNITSTSRTAEDKHETLSQDETKNGDPGSLLCLTACLIGQTVEVQVKNGSVYSGIFHTANADKDYGIVLRMARLISNGLSKDETNDNAKELPRRPVKTFIVHAHDLVQIIAKDVPLQEEWFQNGRSCDNRSDIVTDSFLSQGRHGEIERELKPWTPDKDDPVDLGLESTFQNTWNRNWDQFEINKSLFGVESTFDEELYTTKLERGPQMREREREACRIAREIEGQGTRNLHLAEERGVNIMKEFELMDEESRYSSVLRTTSEDIGDDNNDGSMDFYNDVTFGNSIDEPETVASEHNKSKPTFKDVAVAEAVRNKPSPDLNEVKSKPIEVEPSCSAQVSTMGLLDSHQIRSDNAKDRVSQTIIDRSKLIVKVGGLHSPLVSPRIGDLTSIQALDLDPGFPQVTEEVYREFNEFKLQESAKRGRKQREDQVNELKSFSESLRDLTSVRQHTGASGSTRKMASLYGPPAAALPIPESINSDVSGSDSIAAASTKTQVAVLEEDIEPTENVGSETNSQSDRQVETASSSGATSSPQITEALIASLSSSSSTPVPSSPSSSSGVSDFKKKSSLNPNAKEFKLNPNAMSFTPSFTPLRPPSPVIQGPLYVPGMMVPVPPIQTVPVGANSQSTGRYPPYSPGAISYMPPPPYTPVSGALVPPPLSGGQPAMKMLPQLQQPVPQAVRYPSQVQPVQQTSSYVHPTAQMYPQQVMFSPRGQVAYFHPYLQIQGLMPPPPPQPLQTGQQSQPRHRGQHLRPLAAQQQVNTSSAPASDKAMAPPVSSMQPPPPSVVPATGGNTAKSVGSKTASFQPERL